MSVGPAPIPVIGTLSPGGRRAVRMILGVACVIGVLIGLWAFQLHLRADPLADVRAYYDAGARLNAGLPLYQQSATTNDAGFYRYPPLLAILWRPLALLPFETAALAWEVLMIAVTILTIPLLRPRRAALMATCILAMPILWTLAIGQAQALVTFLLALGSPFGVAFAGHLKLTPWLVAVYWVTRRDVRALLRFAGWMAALTAVQVVLAPGATLDYLHFISIDQVGEVVSLSPYAVSPALWAVSVVLLVLIAVRLGPTRWGWAAAVVLAVGATPRLLGYQLSTLLAMFGGPRETAPMDSGDRDGTANHSTGPS